MDNHLEIVAERLERSLRFLYFSVSIFSILLFIGLAFVYFLLLPFSSFLVLTVIGFFLFSLLVGKVILGFSIRRRLREAQKALESESSSLDDLLKYCQDRSGHFIVLQSRLGESRGKF